MRACVFVRVRESSLSFDWFVVCLGCVCVYVCDGMVVSPGCVCDGVDCEFRLG